MFIHGGWLHIGGNMLYLWIFGNNIEDIVGHFRFVVFYILCGLIATLAHVLSSPNSQIPMVGASGAIAGVLGAYFVSFPGARVRVLIPILIFFYSVRIPAIIVLGFWFLIQILNASAMPGQMGGVAWFAHIGGFIAGMVLVKIYRRRRYSTRYK
jgi:membrane associated rhomboid family serine protease